VLALLHALVQERRTYIPQGWSKFYEFSYSDLKAGNELVRFICKDPRNINWQTAYGLFENSVYGGRIDEPFDMNVLRAYLEMYFNPKILSSQKVSLGSRSFSVPVSKNFNDFQAIVSTFPEEDNPSLFGLPLNVSKAVQRYNSIQVHIFVIIQFLDNRCSEANSSQKRRGPQV